MPVRHDPPLRDHRAAHRDGAGRLRRLRRLHPRAGARLVRRARRRPRTRSPRCGSPRRPARSTPPGCSCDRASLEEFALAEKGETIPMELRLRARRDQVCGSARVIGAVDRLFESAGGRALNSSARRSSGSGATRTPARVHAVNDLERALVMFGKSRVRRPGAGGPVLMTAPASAATDAGTPTFDSTSRFATTAADGPGRGLTSTTTTPARPTRCGRAPAGRPAARRRAGRVGVEQLRAQRRRPRRAFRVLAVDQPGFGRSDKPAEHPQYFTHSRRRAGRAARRARHREGAPGRQLARRRHRRPVRAAPPEARRPAGADGAGRAEAQRVRARTRPRASSG